MTKFKFTSNISSCNDIDEGKWYARGKDNEPGLTSFGIIDTLNDLNDGKLDKNDFDSCDVCVSNLYRTWCTSVILYSKPKRENKKQYLNLLVCPYLKEKHKEIGNAPKPINHMAEKFLIFLNRLPAILQKYKELLPYNSLEFDFPGEIDLVFPLNKDRVIKYTRNDKTYSYDKKNIQNITNGPEWSQDGNLEKFMGWFEQNVTSNEDADAYKKIHVVCHSGLMQSYLKPLIIDLKQMKIMPSEEVTQYELRKQFIKLDIDVLKEIENQNENYINSTYRKLYRKLQEVEKELELEINIGDTNCWSFETKPNILNNKKVLDFLKRDEPRSGKAKNISQIIETIEIRLNQLPETLKNAPFSEEIKEKLINELSFHKDDIYHILESIKLGVVRNLEYEKKFEQYLKRSGISLSLCGKTGSIKREFIPFVKRQIIPFRKGGGTKRKNRKKKKSLCGTYGRVGGTKIKKRNKKQTHKKKYLI